MSHSTILLGFYFSLLVFLPAGAYIMFRWGKKVVKPLARDIDQSKSIDIPGIATKTFFYMIPSIIACGVFAAPVLYFNYLLKQEDYCKEIIRFNKLSKSDPILKERCSCFHVDELFKSVNAGQ